MKRLLYLYRKNMNLKIKKPRLRLLLMRHDSSIGLTTQSAVTPTDFWNVCSSPSLAKEYCRKLDCMLRNMRDRLGLNTPQFQKLVLLVRRQVARVAGRAWRVGIARQWSCSFPLYIFSMRGGVSMISSLHAWTYPLTGLLLLLLPEPTCEWHSTCVDQSTDRHVIVTITGAHL